MFSNVTNDSRGASCFFLFFISFSTGPLRLDLLDLLDLLDIGKMIDSV